MAESLKDKIGKAREKLSRDAGGAIDILRAETVKLEMKEDGLRLDRVRRQLQSDLFDIMVAGRFKTGKSTLMNALLGRLTRPIRLPDGALGPMPTDNLPTTAVLTSVRYSDTPYVRVWKFDGSKEEWTLERYLRDATVKADEEQNQRFFADVRQFEVGLPVELCQAGVTLWDSPGTDDMPHRTEITVQAVQACDAAIVVYRSDVFAGQGEREFASNVIEKSGTRIFTVINMWGAKQPDERFRAFVWNRLVKDGRNGPAYTAGADFAAKDIYFIDARKAEESRFRGDSAAADVSGLALFEKRLGEFLLRDRFRAHVAKFVHSADDVASGVQQKIGRRVEALSADEAKLHRAHENIQPQLAAVDRRREKLPRIVERCRRECTRELTIGFEQVVNGLIRDLPAELDARWKPDKGVFDQFRQKKLCAEAFQTANAVIGERINAWVGKSGGAHKILADVIDRMAEDIRNEVAQLERQFDQIHFEMSGWSGQAQGGGRVVGTGERIASAFAGLLVGDFAAILAPTGGGMRTVGWNLAGQLGAGIALGVMGLAGSVVFIPAIMVAGILAGLVGGNLGLDQRIKRKVLADIIDGTVVEGKAVPGLRHAASETRPLIEAQARKMFDKLETDIMTSVGAVIDAEKRNIQKMLEDNARGREEKVAIRAALEACANTVLGQRQTLRLVETNLHQVA